MTFFHKNNKIYLPHTLLVTILLVGWLIGGITVAFAQDNPNVPTVKVRKKPKKVKRQKPGNDRESVKDTYQRPKTKSTPEDVKDQYKAPRTRSNRGKVQDNYRQPRSRKKDGKVKDTYKRPPSVTNDGKVKIKDANVRQSLSFEEGQEAPRPSFWQRIFRRNAPGTDRGSIRLGINEDPHPGTGYITNRNRQNIDLKKQSYERHLYEGRLKKRQLPRFVELQQQKNEAHQYTQHHGQIKVPKPRMQRRHQSRQAHKVTGSTGPVSFKQPTHERQIRQNEETSDEVSRYSGSIKVRTQKHQTRFYEKQAKETHQYSGSIKVRTQKHQTRFYEKQAKETHQYSGSIKVRTQKHQMRFYEKQAEEIHGFQGFVKVRTPGHQTRYFKKQSKEIHQFNGLMRIRKPQKDMHPSVSYLKSKTSRSYEQKEKFRKWKIKWHRFFKDAEQPKHLKEKTRKPRYDKNETEIWYY